MFGTIIIAAHNEAAVIERCLDPLAPLVGAGEARVVVVCNGCRDDTAERARRLSGVTVLELEIASKAAALRAGDLEAGRGPRLYLDADVVLPSAAARAVLEALQTDQPRAARPPVRFETAHSAPFVRAWYRTRVQLPSISHVIWGNGMYAMSEAGRSRFEEFPDIVSDDLFVQSLFSAGEVDFLQTEPVTVFAPATTASLLRILTRTYRTQREVNATAARLSRGQRNQLVDLAVLLRHRPGAFIDAAVYVTLIAIARVKAGASSSAQRWERDESSRSATGAP